MMLLGLLALRYVLPLSTNDAPEHYFRALSVSQGKFRVERFSQNALGMEVQEVQRDFIHYMWLPHWKAERDRSYLRSIPDFRSSPDSPLVVKEFSNTAVYSPLNYLPQALGLWVAKLFTTKLLTHYYLACFFNLLIYSLLAYGAVKVRSGFSPFFAVALSLPFMLLQALSLSADAINYALPLFFLAYILSLMNRPSLSNKERVTVFVLVMALAMLKPNHCPFMVFLLLLPPREWKWAAMALIPAVSFFVWWTRPYGDVGIAAWFNVPSNPAAQLELLKTQPLEVWKVLFYYLKTYFFIHWFSGYGNLFVVEGQIFKTGRVVAAIAALAMMASVVTSAPWITARRRQIMGLGIVLFALGEIVLSYLLLWVTHSDGFRNGVVGIQHRYFFLFIGLSLFGAALLIPIQKSKFFERGTRTLLFLALGAQAFMLLNVVFLHRAEWPQ